ncbi:MAG: hypothetical protein PUG77_00570 [Helicobacter bilis]|uniref:hypothetical protein n=1 Tax=Helicobacter bilis TaxID=37372 RepID=UPI0026EBA673|nr:hypothetical protein [Helicobacter bilis]MDD7295775.1 hypothetical protein [Helicobacter bilis]
MNFHIHPPPPCIKNGITKEQRIEATQNISKCYIQRNTKSQSMQKIMLNLIACILVILGIQMRQ